MQLLLIYYLHEIKWSLLGKAQLSFEALGFLFKEEIQNIPLCQACI